MPKQPLTFSCTARTFAGLIYLDDETIGLSDGTRTHIGNISNVRTRMRMHQILLSLAMATACGIICETPVLSQEYRGTLEQQMACTPDVFRLCGEQIPDVNRIVACLRQNTPQLSGPCRAVFDSSANANPQNPPQPGVPQQAPLRRRDYQ
jgi:hypothetical protein